MTPVPKKPIPINAELIYYQLTEIKNELTEIKKAYVTKQESQALRIEIELLRDDVAELKKTTSDEIERLKGRNQAKNTILWVGLVASAIINIIAVYNLFVKK